MGNLNERSATYPTSDILTNYFIIHDHSPPQKQKMNLFSRFFFTSGKVDFFYTTLKNLNVGWRKSKSKKID